MEVQEEGMGLEEEFVLEASPLLLHDSSAIALLFHVASLLHFHPSSSLPFNTFTIGSSSTFTHQHSSLFSQNHQKSRFLFVYSSKGNGKITKITKNLDSSLYILARAMVKLQKTDGM